MAYLKGVTMKFNERWDRNYLYAKEYYMKYGNLNVPWNYVLEDGFKLGSFISNQRTAYNGTGTSKFSIERIEKLENIGMIWNVRLYKLLNQEITDKTKKKVYKMLLKKIYNLLDSLDGSYFYSIDDVYYVNQLVMEELEDKKLIKK